MLGAHLDKLVVPTWGELVLIIVELLRSGFLGRDEVGIVEMVVSLPAQEIVWIHQLRVLLLFLVRLEAVKVVVHHYQPVVLVVLLVVVVQEKIQVILVGQSARHILAHVETAQDRR